MNTVCKNKLLGRGATSGKIWKTTAERKLVRNNQEWSGTTKERKHTIVTVYSQPSIPSPSNKEVQYVGGVKLRDFQAVWLPVELVHKTK